MRPQSRPAVADFGGPNVDSNIRRGVIATAAAQAAAAQTGKARSGPLAQPSLAGQRRSSDATARPGGSAPGAAEADGWDAADGGDGAEDESLEDGEWVAEDDSGGDHAAPEAANRARGARADDISSDFEDAVAAEGTVDRLLRRGAGNAGGAGNARGVELSIDEQRRLNNVRLAEHNVKTSQPDYEARKAEMARFLLEQGQARGRGPRVGASPAFGGLMGDNSGLPPGGVGGLGGTIPHQRRFFGPGELPNNGGSTSTAADRVRRTREESRGWGGVPPVAVQPGSGGRAPGTRPTGVPRHFDGNGGFFAGLFTRRNLLVGFFLLMINFRRIIFVFKNGWALLTGGTMEDMDDSSATGGTGVGS